MTRCRCGMLAHRSTWGRLPLSPKAWLLKLRNNLVYECYGGHVWAGKEEPCG